MAGSLDSNKGGRERERKGVIRLKILVRENYLFSKERKRREEKFEIKIEKREDLFIIYIKRNIYSLIS